MNEKYGRAIADSILAGTSEVLDALLSLVLSVEINAVEECTPDAMPLWLGTYPISATIGTGPSGQGVSLLMETAAALEILARLDGTTPGERESLTDAEVTSLADTLGMAFSQGVSRFLEDSGKPSLGQSPSEVRNGGDADAPAVLGTLGNNVAAVQFSLASDPDFRIDGMLIYSESLEALVGGDEAAPAAPATNVLSPEEMNDILSGFDPSPPEPAQDYVPSSTPVPMNIDMVLDIKLRATARLGIVELPLSDVLSFGPGTIIDVGRLVDEPVDLLVNNKLIARGDVVVVDERYGLRITEIVSQRERIESLR